ncbi:MAG: hypothetical protein JNM89_00705 [Hyphomicrobiaceae bacterium]|nr:hypothetical protein [Hyphomicrobiaceae bacterium]
MSPIASGFAASSQAKPTSFKSDMTSGRAAEAQLYGRILGKVKPQQTGSQAASCASRRLPRGGKRLLQRSKKLCDFECDAELDDLALWGYVNVTALFFLESDRSAFANVAGSSRFRRNCCGQCIAFRIIWHAKAAGEPLQRPKPSTASQGENAA